MELSRSRGSARKGSVCGLRLRAKICLGPFKTEIKLLGGLRPHIGLIKIIHIILHIKKNNSQQLQLLGAWPREVSTILKATQLVRDIRHN